MWVGRWAQVGFLASMIGEFTTGKGTLAQIGFDVPSIPVLALILALAGGATIVGSVKTLQRVKNKQMSKK